MTAASTSTVESTEAKGRAAYLVQRDARKRYSFGKVWEQNVAEGKVSDRAKLLAHAVKLKAGDKSKLAKLSMPTLLAKVQAKLSA